MLGFNTMMKIQILSVQFHRLNSNKIIKEVQLTSSFCANFLIYFSDFSESKIL